MYVPEAALPAKGSPAMFQVFLEHGWDLNYETMTGMPRAQYAHPIRSDGMR
jgi:hypothetical protein